MDETAIQLAIEAAIALGIGLFVGLEREQRHVGEEGPAARTVMGVRTFALLALLGWITRAFGAGWPWLAPTMLVVVGLLIVAQYVRENANATRLGLTTEIAALVVFVLGMLVHEARLFAVALALIVTLVLISKPWVRSVVPSLRRSDLTSTLQLALVLAIVLPLLPTAPVDPWGVLPPRRIGLFVVLVAGVGFVGYVLSRLLGRSRAAGLTGAVGGLVSSTAVTAAMASQARDTPSLAAPGQLATLLANAVMCARVQVITAVVSRPVALRLLPTLGVMCLVLLGFAAWKARTRSAGRSAHAPAAHKPRAARTAGESHPDDHDLGVSNPFALLPALKWGLFLCAVLLASHFASQYLGSRGLLATAAASGLADTDAITLVAARQAAAGLIGTDLAALAVGIAVLANTLVKASIACVSGGLAYGRGVVIAFAAAASAAALALAVT